MRRCSALHGIVSVAWLCLTATASAAEPASALIKVRADKVVSQITPYMTGSCIEDVNHEIYGGIYSQMIFGESFEEPGLDKSVEAMGFDRFGGGWTLGPEGLEASSGPGYKLVLRDREVGDGEISVSLFFPDRTGYAAGLIARVREAGVGPDAFVGYELALGPSANFARIGRHRKNWEPMKASLPCPEDDRGVPPAALRGGGCRRPRRAS